jgi:hypothetical protein
MIVFRQVDARYPFLWEDARQPAGRWHGDGAGPAHYFADTPDGAWAEFLRHEEITDARDLPTIRRRMWAVDVGDAPATRVDLPEATLTGGRETYDACQRAAAKLRRAGVMRIVARTAALVAAGARGIRMAAGERPAAPRDGDTIVLFGPPDDCVGWIAADEASPPPDLLERVRHYR